MNKNRLVKMVSVITGTIMIGFIVYYIMEGDWSEVIFFSCLFFGLWIIPGFLKNMTKEK